MPPAPQEAGAGGDAAGGDAVRDLAAAYAADTPEAQQARRIAGKLEQQLQGVANITTTGNKIKITAQPGQVIDEETWSGLRIIATHPDFYLRLAGVELAYQDPTSKVFKRLPIGNFAATELFNAIYGKHQTGAEAEAIDKGKAAWSTVFPELKNADDLDAAFAPISGVILKGIPKGVIDSEIVVDGCDPGAP